MQLKSTHYLPLFRVSQKLLSSYFPKNFSLELEIDFDWNSRMLWIWSCPVNAKELCLKIPIPKRQNP